MDARANTEEATSAKDVAPPPPANPISDCPKSLEPWLAGPLMFDLITTLEAQRFQGRQMTSEEAQAVVDDAGALLFEGATIDGGGKPMNGEHILVVFKRIYKVGWYTGGKLNPELGCHPISMGAWPYEAKFQRDNMSTPEGWYQVGEKRTRKDDDNWRYSRFDWVLQSDYPRVKDIQVAIDKDVIDKPTAAGLMYSNAVGNLPSQRTGMGGQLHLHSYYTYDKAATMGCVGIDTQPMIDYFHASRGNEPIYFVPWQSIWLTDGMVRHDPNIPAEPKPTFDWDWDELREEYGYIDENGNSNIVLPELTIRASEVAAP